MAEEKVLNTRTSVSIQGSNIIIRAYYQEGSSILNTLAASISEIVQTIDGVQVVEGELYTQMINYPQEIDYNIDNNGDLFINAEDSENYYIDSNGDLIYVEN